jgi:hypothetical protein
MEATMQIYWSLKSIPELANLASAERRQAWRAACWNAYRHWQVWASVAGIGFGAVAGGYLGSLVIFEVIGSVIGAALGGLIHGQVLTEFASPYLRTFSTVQLR